MAAKKKKKKKKKLGAKQAAKELREYALTFPGAHEDFPWGERVVKVKKKVFVFLGRDFGDLGMSVKLPKSKKQALAKSFCEPTGYGLGKSGWVNVSFEDNTLPPLETLKAWMDESYRAVAPKKLIAELDER
jgi:predicted DNA-binding protein (MmcQ/YjbR family)